MSVGFTKGKLEEKDKIRAMHIETESKYANAALLALSSKFGKTKSTFPGERHMRFFPEYNRVRSIENQNKIVQARKRQGNFLTAIRRVYNGDILVLDKRAKLPKGGFLPTLRCALPTSSVNNTKALNAALPTAINLSLTEDGRTEGRDTSGPAWNI